VVGEVRHRGLQAPEDGGPGPAGTHRERHRSLLARDIATALAAVIADDIATRTVIATALRPDIASQASPTSPVPPVTTAPGLKWLFGS
jgi:hypothetical protein